MSDMYISENTARALGSLVDSVRKPDGYGFPGKLNADGVTYTFYVPAEQGKIYIRIWRGGEQTLDTAINLGVPLDPGLLCELWRVEGHWVIKDPDPIHAMRRYGANVSQAGVPPHSGSPGLGGIDDVESDRFLPGLVRHPTPTETENGIGLTVVIEDLNYDDGTAVKRYLNLQTPTDYRPPTSGKRWWASIYQDVDGDIKASTTNSAEVVLPMNDMLVDGIYDIPIPVGAIRLAGVTLENGQTTVTPTNTRIVDVRNFLTPALAYQTVQDDGTPVDKQRALNLIAGTNMTITVTDDPVNARTDVEFESTAGGSGGSVTVGAYASARPATPSTGDLYVVTDGVWNQEVWSGSAWRPMLHGSLLTKPPTGGWTSVNAGGVGDMIVDDTKGGIAISAAANASQNIRVYHRNAASAPYEIIAGVVVNTGLFATNYAAAYLGWRQNSDGKLTGIVMQSNDTATTGFYFKSEKYTNATTFSAQYLQLSALYAPFFWVKLEDDNTNRIISISIDKVNWQVLHSVGRTDFLTGDQVFFGVESLNATYPATSMLVSWE